VAPKGGRSNCQPNQHARDSGGATEGESEGDATMLRERGGGDEKVSPLLLVGCHYRSLPPARNANRIDQ